MKIETTFKKLHDAGACNGRYQHLGRELGGIMKYGRTRPITLLQILDANGLDDALWAGCACDMDREGEIILHELDRLAVTLNDGPLVCAAEAGEVVRK